MKKLLALTAVLLASSALAAERFITVGPPVTETLFALGLGDQIVAIDDSSAAVPAAAKLPKVGYQRALSAEALLALQPTRIVGSAEAGPPPTLEALRAAKVKVEIYDAKPTAAAARSRIEAIAKSLGKEKEAQGVLKKLDEDLRTLALETATKKGPKLKVISIYSRGPGGWMVAGTETLADELIRLVGAQNTVKEFSGYRPLSPEAAAASAPDIILLPEGTAKMAGGVDKILASSPLAGTPAAKTARVITLEDTHFFGAGPRFGAAARELAAKLNEKRM